MTDLPDVLGALPLRVERCDLQPLAFETPSFTRVTTVVEITGGGHVGRGEDVTYTPADQDEHRAHAPFRLIFHSFLAKPAPRRGHGGIVPPRATLRRGTHATPRSR